MLFTVGHGFVYRQVACGNATIVAYFHLSYLMRVEVGAWINKISNLANKCLCECTDPHSRCSTGALQVRVILGRKLAKRASTDV